MAGERTPLLASHANGDHDGQQSSPVRQRFSESVDPDSCGPALTLQFVIAGAADAAAYGQTGTWVGFMTGNLTQLAISAVNATLTHPAPDESVQRIMLSSSAIVGFVVGAIMATFVDQRFHGKHRGKLITMALLRGVGFAILSAWLMRHGWQGFGGFVVLFIMAVNMGSMCVSAMKLGSTPYNTTVVITSTLASLFSDPRLPYGFSGPALTRAISIIALVVGGAAAQTIVLLSKRYLESDFLVLGSQQQSPVGSAWAVALVAVLELLAAAAWLRAKPSSA